MTRRPIEIEIDELVVAGLETGAEGALRDAIAAELARRLPSDVVSSEIESIAAALVERLAP